MTWRGVVLGCALACVPWLARAEVKTRLRPDGSWEVYNDGPARAGRPQQLRPLPDAAWDAWVREHAARHALDPRLVQAVMQAESGYDPRAVSRKGAIGLMQLMPATARLLQVPDPYSPEQNIGGGAAYLRKMLDLFEGSLELALAAYNAGPGAVQRYGGVPPFAETRQYVDRVLGLYRGGSSVRVGVGGGGGSARRHGLATSASRSPLQQALAKGALQRPSAAATAAASGG